MVIDKDYFFDGLRKKLKKISQEQVSMINIILDTWDKSGYKDLRWLAYMFGTIYHETAATMLPIEEYGKGKNRPYGKRQKRSGVAYSSSLPLYYGRGLVQLTWYENYELMGRLIKEDLLKNPEKACEQLTATKILFEGMTKGASSFGDFTGKCLEMYFNDKTEDWTGARFIINGKRNKADKFADKAELIRDHSIFFLNHLRVAA